MLDFTRPCIDIASLDDDPLLEAVQLQTFRFFWEGAHPASGLARDRQGLTGHPRNDLAVTGGTGFGILAIIVAIERLWIARESGFERIALILHFLEKADRYHGMFAHFINGRTAQTVPFTRKDDGGDCLETALLFQGLLCARQYFHRNTPSERGLRERIDRLWHAVEWNWYSRNEDVLYWHWSEKHGWAMDCKIAGWNEGLLAYVLAAGSPTHPIQERAYHRGFTRNGDMCNQSSYYGITLPLGADYGGPLFLAHYAFCGIDPRGLRDRYADYWEQNVAHARINHEHCVRNPNGHAGYGSNCWGLTSGHGPFGYVAHAPDKDLGVITPSAALSSFPYTPIESMKALRHFLTKPMGRIWGRFGFVDAFCKNREWYARTYLAINQGPIVVMIENFRSGLLWDLFMSAPEVRFGLEMLGFARQNNR